MNATKSGNALLSSFNLNPRLRLRLEVILNGLPKRVHRTPPGHGNASARNALMSTRV